MKKFAEQFYKSNEWRKISRMYMTSQNYICERCGGVGEICHHRIHLTPKNINDPNITLNFNNLECLCRECHYEEHSKSNRLHFEVQFDKDGNVIRKPDVFVVCGCPGSGKTHYVKENRKVGDLVVDFDYLCAALYCSDDIYFDHLPLMDVALNVREHIYKLIENRKSRWSKAWVITAEPDILLQRQLAYRLKADLITVNASPEVCKENIKNDPRRQNKEAYYTLVDEWYDKNKKSKEKYADIFG